MCNGDSRVMTNTKLGFDSIGATIWTIQGLNIDYIFERLLPELANFIHCLPGLQSSRELEQQCSQTPNMDRGHLEEPST